MKTIPTILALCATCYCATAQDIQASIKEQVDKPEKIRRNELGLTAEMDVFSGWNTTTAFQAIQYKRWKNEHFGARFLLGRKDYYSNNDFAASYQINGDTVVTLKPVTSGSVAIIGAGLEGQRQFYKRVHLFAAVEVKCGYGRGSIDTFTERALQSDPDKILPPPPHAPIVTGKSPASTDIYHISLVPTFGGKIQFKRICFGSEMALNFLNYTNIRHPNKHAIGHLDFDLGTINPRVFVHYRF
ncbi:MAG: hypothetical protein H6551_00965 [Chitinophagales bacterium]|nr:hypothetical protein [Chitinophagaceae bacterium]MCB9063694.1 hypothetical protein [Chitinophagales bacterium]